MMGFTSVRIYEAIYLQMLISKIKCINTQEVTFKTMHFLWSVRTADTVSVHVHGRSLVVDVTLAGRLGATGGCKNEV